MFNKTLLKILVAFGLLAGLMIFLAVNFVPGISAQSTSKRSAANAMREVGSDYFERHPSVAARPVNGAASDYFERHLSVITRPVSAAPSDYFERHSSVIARPVSVAPSDYFERHPSAITQPVNSAASDYYERHPSNYYDNSDWIERHSKQQEP